MNGAQSGSTSRRPPSHRPTVKRFPILFLVIVVLIGAGLADRIAGVRSTPVPAPTLAAVGAPLSSESSSWYCAGGTGNSTGIANSTVYLTNTSRDPLVASAHVVNDSGVSQSKKFVLPALAEVSFVPDTVVQGNWVATRIEVNGGGVVATQVVSGPNGWSESPCSSTIGSTWYFADGSTASGSRLLVSLYNPAATNAVVDLTCVTQQGAIQPQPFEGIVVPAGQLVEEEIGTYVQNAASVAVAAYARSGRIVANEIQLANGNGIQGVSLQLGSPATTQRATLPLSQDVPGGSSTISVFNPSSSAENVTVSVKLPSGPVAPFNDTVPAQSAWSLVTSSQSRIPLNVAFSATVTVSGGPGVVVSRAMSAAFGSSVPQWGSAVASVPSYLAVSGWVIPFPGTPSSPALPGATPLDLAVYNAGTRPVTFSISSITSSGIVPLKPPVAVRLTPGELTVIPQAVMSAAGPYPLVIKASGPVAMLENLIPAGAGGVVTISGVPLRY
ncbi:MAG: DUF5719 family protein [Acidimicrobiales bacterium]